MSKFSEALNEIVELHERFGTAELSRKAGIPYMTLKDAAGRRFSHRSTDILDQLSKLAEAEAKNRKAKKQVTA